MFTVNGIHATYTVEDAVLSKGGVGSIHRTSSPGLVYKRYFSSDKAPAREHLERLVTVGRDVLVRQALKPGQTPESSVNWPVDLVLDSAGQAVAGVVLPLIPQPLFNEEHDGVRGLEFLVMARAKPPAARARIVLLLRMAEILAFVDSRGLVHGDINGKNLAWSVAPEPVMYLIDCDGMVPQEPPPSTGVQAMGWTDPRIVERRVAAHDQYSDWYALALAMYRGLLLTAGNLQRKPDGSWPGPGQIPDEFPSALADLVRRGLDPLDESRRPRPGEWVRALAGTYLPDGKFDEAAIARLDTMAAPRAADPGFVPLPPSDWTSHSQPHLNTPAPPPPRPVPPPPPPPPPIQQRRPAPPPPPAPTYGGGWQGPRSIGPSGGAAQAALSATGSWYATGIAATLFAPPIALIYVCVAFAQLRDVDSDYPGVTRARNALVGFGVTAAVLTLIYFFGAVLSPDQQSTL